MATLLENLDDVFDFSHLNSLEFPTTDFKSVGIAGGGTAGYFTALALRKCHPDLQIELIESSQIPVIGVGESTTTEILPFLHHLLEFDPIEFFEEVRPTLKFGIQFDWGQPGQEPFNFNFFASHHHESYFYEKHIKNSNWASVLMENSKVPVLKSKDNQIISLLSRIPFAYHIDNKKIVSYLKTKVLACGINIIDAKIETALTDNNGFVTQLKTDKGSSHSYDLYIDCTGFRSELLGKTLKTPFVSFEKTLITDRALTFSLPNSGKIDPFTGALTMKNGWCWKIPMRDEDHYGYVYSSKFCTDEEAQAEVQERFGPSASYKKIHFRSGRHEKAFNKNVFAIGNAYAFVEPLESTAIQTVIHSIMLLCRLMPRTLKDQSSITGLNKEVAANWDTFRWFLGAHYKFNKKASTPFWSWCNKNTDIGDAQHIYDLFQHKAPFSKGHYGTTSGFSAYEPLVFNGYSYDTLFFGQGLVPTNIHPPEMTQDQYFKKIASYQELSAEALTQVDLFNNIELLYQSLLPDLFNDPDSWVTDTTI